MSRPALFLRLAFVLAAVAALVVPASLAGCGSGNSCAPGMFQADNDCGKQCVSNGGIVANGACVAKCDPKDCLANNTCVNNECQLECTSYKDCQLGTQDCLKATEDGTGKSIFTCQSSNKAPFATSCPFGTECDALKACPNGDSCDYTQCGGMECKLDTASCTGIPNCALGLCPDGKTSCTVPGCPQDQCVSLTCITKGKADANAYCSLEDCNTDSDCPSSFLCGISRDPHDICDGSNNTLKEKGNNSLCGSTDAGDCSLGQTCPTGTYCDMDGRCTGNCVDPKSFSKDGHTFFEGSVCLLRHTCLERRLCDPCDVDGQCANLPGGACIQIGGESRCTVGCAQDSDCQPDYKCDNKYCQPRFGKCVGDGKFCEPCLSDQDCGDKSTRKACVSGSRNQQACEDLAFPKACKGDADCGLDDKGDHLHCWGGQALPHVYQSLDEASGQRPEGIVVKGTSAYVGFAYTGEIVIYDLRSGTKGHFGAGPDLQNGTLGLMLGMAFHPTTGELYVGVASFNPAMVPPGIYKVPAAGGTATLVASDAQMTFPNGLAFDSAANLYVTESNAGLIYKVVGGVASIWLDDASLKPNATNCTPNTPVPIGANGMFLEGTGASAAMVVTNTNLAQVVKIPINADGTAGVPAIIAGPDCNTLGGIDGIVNDTASGTFIAVDNTQNKIVRITPTGTVTTLASGKPMNGPASLAFASFFGQELVITNSDFSSGAGGPGLLTLLNSDGCSAGTACGSVGTCQSCDSDNDCPTSPSGLHGHCYGTPWDGDDTALTGSGMLPADECVPLVYQGQIFCDGYKSCGLPIKNLSTLQTGCW